MTWAREAFRGTVTSSVAIALLLAAALVAVSGAGASAVSSLGQLASGPEVPPTPVELVDRDAPAGADVAMLDDQWGGSPGSPSSTGSAVRGSEAGAGAGADVADLGGRQVARGPSGQGAASGGSAPRGSQGGASQGAAPGSNPGSGSGGGSSSQPAPSRPDPLRDTLDNTRDQADDLLNPVKPITDQLLNGLPR